MKTCTKCCTEKPFSDFGICSRRKDGTQLMCKPCHRDYYSSYREKKPEIVLSTAARWRQRNPETVVLKRQKERIENPERLKKYSAKYRENNPEKRKEICKKYRDKNLEKEKAYRKIYCAENLDKLAAKSAKRRAWKMQCTPAWASDDLILEIYSEAIRISEELGVSYHVDHIVPLQSKLVCGLHCEANLRIILGAENISKGNRHWPDMP